MDFIELNVAERKNIGKGASRQLRSQGFVPAVLYGGSGSQTLALQLNNKEVTKLLQDGGRNAVLKLNGLPKNTNAIIKEIQREYSKDKIFHIDFLRVAMDTEIETNLTVELVGEAEGVRLGGVLQHSLRELVIKALPKDIPEKYEIDISDLEVGSSIRIADLKTSPGVEIMGNPEDVVVSVVPPTKEEEVVVEEPEEGEEGEAAEEGAEPEGEGKPEEAPSEEKQE